MYGELTDKETVARVEYALEHQQHDQFEILLYKKNSKYTIWYQLILSPPPSCFGTILRKWCRKTENGVVSRDGR